MLKKFHSIFVFIILFLIICKSSFGKSQIVTPDRLIKTNETHGIPNNSKVEVTDKKLKETKALREEINRAVQEDRYHVTYENSTQLKNSSINIKNSNKTNSNINSSLQPDSKSNNSTTKTNKEIVVKVSPKAKEAEDVVGNNFNRNSGIKDSNSNEFPSISNNDTSFSYDDGGVQNDSNNKKNPKINIKPNTVHSQLAPVDEENRQKYLLEDFLPKQFVERELLTVTSIEEDPRFILGDGVEEWKILKTEEEHYWIGIKSHDILIINNKKYDDATRLDFGYRIENIEIFTFWNKTSDHSSGIILISINNSILWIESKGFQFTWTWNIGKKAKIMKYYEIDGRQFLAILTVTDKNENYSINVYEFVEETKEFWIIQVIPLKYPTQEMVFLDTGREVILAITQGNNVLVYDYNPDSENRYELAEKFTSEDLKSISAFKMGGYSYLAISGRNSKILRYYRGDFITQTLFGEHFKWVHMYFPIPARTYRDDLILLVQHYMEFEGHSLMVLEALVWNGQSFEASGDIPCTLGSETFNFGVSCMIDLERESGISGAAIIGGGQNISIIVPREDAPSGIFTIHTILKERKTEVQELEEIYKFLNSTASEQEQIINATECFIQNSDNITDLNLEYFSASELLFSGEIEEILINGIALNQNEEIIDIEALINELKELNEVVVNIEGELNIGKTGEETRSLEEENIEDCLNPKPRFNRSITNFNFTDLELVSIIVDNLLVDSINNNTIPMLIKNDTLNFNGTIIFENELIIKNELNIIQNSSHYNRAFGKDDNNLEIDELTIDGDMEFDIVNGLDWFEFLSKVTITQFPAQFETLIVEGDVIIDESLGIETLNKIPFPDGFLWSSGPTTSIITARKNFTGTLKTSALDTGGLINGIDPFTFVTLSTDQKIPGKTVFKSLEVTELLELNGTVSGQGLSDFLANPTILDSTVINSACQFNVLKVEGNINILNEFNGENVDGILDEIVIKSDSKNPVLINSKKEFTNGIKCTDNVVLTTDRINDILIKDFITADSDQELDITNLNGDITFEKLTLNQYYNSINIQNLFENYVSIKNTDFLNITLIFEDPKLLNLSTLLVLNSLNNESCNDLRNINEDMTFEELKFDSLDVDVVESECDIIGSDSTFNGMDLRSLNSENNTENEENQFSKDMHFDEIIFENGLEVEFLNGYEVHKAIKILEQVHDIPYMVKQGLVTVSEFVINGNVTINAINGKIFDQEILSRVIWLNRPNHIINPIIFTAPITFDNELQIGGLLNDQNFNDLINDIVWKSDIEIHNKTNNLEINAQKTFLNNIEVEGNTDVMYLNEGSTTNLAKTNENCHFKGSVFINGDLDVSNLYVGQYFNEVESEIFTNLCRFDSELNHFIIGGQVYFKGPTSIKNLELLGNLNNFEKCGDFINNLVYKNESANVFSNIIFEKPIELKVKVFIEMLDNKNISDAFENIVYDNENDIVKIETPVLFKDSVFFEEIQVEKNLYTSNLGGCDLMEWTMNTFMIDESVNLPTLLFGPGSLDSNSMNVAYVNGHDISNIISLNNLQNFNGSVHISEVFLTGHLITKYPINDRFDLESEMRNTVMKNQKSQRITSPITAKTFKVLKNLYIESLVNEIKNISDVVHLQSSTIELNSPVFFKDITVSDMYTKDIISGFNFNEWYDESLWSSGRSKQIITGNWDIENLNVKERIFGNHNVNDIPLDMIRGQLDGPSEDQQKQFKHMADNYNVLCQKVHKLISEFRHKIYFVKYFEKSTQFEENGLITNIHVFQHNKFNYLLSNVNCYTNVYQWDQINSEWILINKFESGSVAEYVPVTDINGNLNIVINSKLNELMSCKNDGINNWVFNGGNFSEHLQSFGNFDSIHYDPNNNGIIYGIPVKQNAVVEMTINNNKIDQNRVWELPAESKGLYRFLPKDTEFGTALSDGKRILIVNKNNELQTRKKRDISSYSNERNSKAETNVTLIKNELKTNLQNLIKNITNSLAIVQKLNDTSEIAQNNYDIHLQFEELKKLNIPDSYYTTFHQKLENNTSLQDPLKLIILNVTHYLWIGIKNVEEIAKISHGNLQIQQHLLMNKKNGYLENLKVFIKKLTTTITKGIASILQILEKEIQVSEFTHNFKSLLHNLINLLVNRYEFLKDSDDKNSQNLNSTTVTSILETSNNSGKGILYTPTITKYSPRNNQINSTNPLFNRKLLEEYFHEPIVSHEIESKARNLLIADNNFIPNKISGEVLAIKVSYLENQRTLFAVISSANHQYGSQSQGSITIFFDVMQGHIFQKIEATSPRNLAVLNIGDETVLGFIDGKNIIKMYIYRGIQGFVEFAQITNEHKIEKLLSVSLPTIQSYKSSICPDFYFIAVGKNHFIFYKAIVAGICSVKNDLKCGNWI